MAPEASHQSRWGEFRTGYYAAFFLVGFLVAFLTTRLVDFLTAFFAGARFTTRLFGAEDFLAAALFGAAFLTAFLTAFLVVFVFLDVDLAMLYLHFVRYES
jgi:hypothetical protein